MRITTQRQSAHPAFDSHGLAGSVHLPVVEDVPARLVEHGLTSGLQTDDRRFVAAGREQHRPEVALLRTKLEGSQPVVVGHAGGAGVHGQLHAVKGCTCSQVRCPHRCASRIGERIDADGRALRPGHRRSVLPVVARVGRRQRHRLDKHDHLTGLATQRTAEVVRSLHGGGAVTGWGDGVVCQERPDRVLAVHIVQAVQVFEIVVERIGGRGKYAHAQLIMVGRHDRQPLVARERIECRDRVVRLDAGQGRADLNPRLRVLAQRLPVDVRERAGDGDGVVRVRPRSAMDDERVVVRARRQTRQLGRHGHLVGVTEVQVQFVIELDVPLRAGRALVLRRARRPHNLERRVRAPGVRRRFRADGVTLGRRRVGADGNGQRCIGGQCVNRTERQPTPVVNAARDLRRVGVPDTLGGGDLGCGREAK